MAEGWRVSQGLHRVFDPLGSYNANQDDLQLLISHNFLNWRFNLLLPRKRVPGWTNNNIIRQA